MSEVVVVGSYVQDLAFQTNTFPLPGETRIGEFRTGPGGKGFNQAIACNRQGISTLFIGAVGDDLFARVVQEFAREDGLKIKLQTVEEHATGAASIVVNREGENLIVVALGANDSLSEKHVESCHAAIAKAEVLVTQLENCLEATEAAIQIARREGVLTILNPAPINAGVELELLQHADIITPNETEFSFLIEKFFGKKLAADYWMKSEQEIHELASLLGVGTVVLTLGKKGCIVSHNATARSASDLLPAMKDEPCYRIPAAEVKTIDTTGAGDAFSGGLAAGLVRFPGDFRRAVVFASVVAALSTTRMGAAPSMPSAEAVNEFMDHL